GVGGGPWRETSMAERLVLSDPIGIRRINLFGRSQTAAAPGSFGLQQMALAGVTPHHLAVGGDFKPLCYGFFRLDTFWASHKCRFLKRRRNIGRLPSTCKERIRLFCRDSQSLAMCLIDYEWVNGARTAS